MPKFAVYFTLVSLMALPVSADDLGLITVKNEYQAQVVQGIVDYAHARVDDRFLALIDANRAASLNRAGIEFEIVLTDADPETTYLIYPPRKKAQRADEAISLSFTIRQYPPTTGGFDPVKSFEYQCRLAEEMMAEKIVPSFVQPLTETIAQKRLS